MDGRTWVASESISVISPARTEEIGNSLKFKVVVAVLFVALTRTYSGARKGSGREGIKGGSATYDGRRVWSLRLRDKAEQRDDRKDSA